MALAKLRRMSPASCSEPEIQPTTGRKAMKRHEAPWEAMLPGHIQAVKDSGVPVVWQCDGVHGNGVVASNKLKTRKLADIMTEIGARAS